MRYPSVPSVASDSQLRRICHFSGGIEVPTAPVTTVPVTLENRTGITVVQLPDHDPTAHVTPAQFAATTFPSHISRLPRVRARLLTNVQVFDWPLLSASFESKTTLLLATDGGLDSNAASFGWCLASHEQTLARGSGISDGHPRFMSSTRAELSGLAAGVLFLAEGLKFLSSHRRTTQWQASVEIWCDNKSAVLRAQRTQQPDCFRTSSRCFGNYDLEALLRHLWSAIPLRVTVTWLPGHQDRIQPRHILPRPAFLNTIADELATSALLASSASPPIPEQELHREAVVDVVHQSHGAITGSISTALRSMLREPAATAYWCASQSWDEPTFASIDHAAYASAIKQYPYPDFVRLVKLRAGWLPTNHRAKHYVQGRTDACPFCGAREDIAHLFRCPHPEAPCRSWLQAIKESLGRLQTHPPLAEALLDGIVAWQEERPRHHGTTISHPSITQALQDQDRIGWQFLPRGFIAMSWATANVELAQAPPRNNWAIALHNAAFDEFLTLWTSRNARLHGTIDEQRARHRATLATAIRRLYSRTSELLPADQRDIFPVPIADLLRRSVLFQSVWVQEATKSIDDALRRSSITPPGQPLITAFFQRTRSMG